MRRSESGPRPEQVTGKMSNGAAEGQKERRAQCEDQNQARDPSK